MSEIYKIIMSIAILILFLIILVGMINLTHRSREVNLIHYFNMFQDGDIIFQTSKSQQSKAIQLATRSRYSHVGIIFKKNKKLYVFEAVQPVKFTPFETWIAQGERQHYVVKRLKKANIILTTEVKRKMEKIGKKFLGRNYDSYFEWSDNRLYCSELVWKVYQVAAGVELGKLETFKDFELSSQPVRQMIRERYGNQVPLNEVVISPASIFESKELVTIYETD